MNSPRDLDATRRAPDRFKHVPRVSDAVLNPLASGLCRAPDRRPTSRGSRHAAPQPGTGPRRRTRCFPVPRRFRRAGLKKRTLTSPRSPRVDSPLSDASDRRRDVAVPDLRPVFSSRSPRGARRLLRVARLWRRGVHYTTQREPASRPFPRRSLSMRSCPVSLPLSAPSIRSFDRRDRYSFVPYSPPPLARRRIESTSLRHAPSLAHTNTLDAQADARLGRRRAARPSREAFRDVGRPGRSTSTGRMRSSSTACASRPSNARAGATPSTCRSRTSARRRRPRYPSRRGPRRAGRRSGPARSPAAPPTTPDPRRRSGRTPTTTRASPPAGASSRTSGSGTA